MRTRPPTTAAAALSAGALLLALTACSDGDDDGESHGATLESSAPAEAAAEPESSPTGPNTTRLTLGERWHWEAESGANGNTTALTYRQPITGITGTGQPGEEWGQAEARICVEAGSVPVQQFPWSVAFEDGTRVDVTGNYGGDFPRPEFPMDTTVNAGDCVRGKIMFPVPTGERPDRIVYTPDGSSGEVVEWTVPAAKGTS